MKTEEAIEIVLDAAEKHADFNPRHDEIKEAVNVVEDFFVNNEEVKLHLAAERRTK